MYSARSWTNFFYDSISKSGMSNFISNFIMDNFILLHNHPSGDPTPSQEDILLTQRVRKAGDLIGIELLDHIIIGDNRYISLREKGFFCGNPG